MEFIPHVVMIAAGDIMKFQNHDKVDHNVMQHDAGYDLGIWAAGHDSEHLFKTEGVFAQACKIHPEMLAYVFVGQSRFAAVVVDEGFRDRWCPGRNGRTRGVEPQAQGPIADGRSRWCHGQISLAR